MKFDKDISLIQQKMSETSIGIARRQNILKELNIQIFQMVTGLNQKALFY